MTSRFSAGTQTSSEKKKKKKQKKKKKKKKKQARDVSWASERARSLFERIFGRWAWNPLRPVRFHDQARTRRRETLAGRIGLATTTIENRAIWGPWSEGLSGNRSE